ncbi:hypothetical protein [Deefgea salmonis]|uniref:Uncharacterized protein n=1 Tax=Deefgea salmonis TaxID=2875502 RepID=A0ABS8BII7_9NEIS|nr:hypothetical protein [Deefgea salmonis]MCB5195520.1 hypothetical protein [Deefgea salmonis]
MVGSSKLEELLTQQELESLNGVYFAELDERPYLTFEGVREASRERMRKRRREAIEKYESERLQDLPTSIE